MVDRLYICPIESKQLLTIKINNMRIIFQHQGFPNRMTEFSVEGNTLLGTGANIEIQKIRVNNPEKIKEIIKNADTASNDDREKLAAYFF